MASGAPSDASPTTSSAPTVFYEKLYKLVVVGDSGVGKTNIINRFCRGKFVHEEKSTIGVEFATKILDMDDGRRVKAQIWDTAGQERYRAITSAYYRGSLGALLVFSITDRESFKNVPRWLKELRDHTGPELVVILVGTKADLTAGRVVTRDEALALKFPYFEVSAKSGDNVTEAVTRLVKDVHAIHHSRSGTGTSPGGKVRVHIQDPHAASASRSRCC
ncbi:Ras family [Plasmodiophora brassicae]|uniref:Uncharacterized protein n=1 Tax=Plasmodiophora brassicae TaxID=37360 RepID=A0A0G4IJH5_PLABS|nr:hypothetical protein PBRA_009658 [Plasmodiophora brassicae]SPR01777.1 unnamed protein product [Plasmodiophora brassicae]